MAFCQMPCVLREADVCMRLFAGIRTRPAVAGMVQERGRFVVGSSHASEERIESALLERGRHFQRTTRWQF